MSFSGQKIVLVVNERVPGEKAAALFAIESAQAFAESGISTCLISPRRSCVTGDVYEYYNAKKNFSHSYLPVLDLYETFIPKWIAFYIGFISFGVAAMFYCLGTTSNDDYIYTNEWFPLLLISFFRKNTVYEVHDYPSDKLRWFYSVLFARVGAVLITNTWKAKKLEKEYPAVLGKWFVELNATDVSSFSVPLERTDARAELALPQEGKIALYTGHLFGWKGVDTLAATAVLAPEIDFYFVGGAPNDIKRFRERYGKQVNIHIMGHQPHAMMPTWQRASDVLVLPNTAKEDISKYYTSPMKLFEYMASGRAIVASDLPSVREVVDDSMVYFAKADSPESFSDAIRQVLDTVGASKIAAARTKVEMHSWRARAERILSVITNGRS